MVRDLQSAADEDHAPVRRDLAEGELDADAEHQEDHADIGSARNVFQVATKARRVRADCHTSDEKAYDRGDAQHLGNAAADECGERDQKDLQKQVRVLHA